MQSTNEFWSRKQFSDCQTSAASQWLLVRDNIGKNVTKTCGHYNAITPPQVTSTATSAECRQATFTQRLKTAASSLWSPSPPTPAPIPPGLCLLPQPVHLQPWCRSTLDTSTTSTREPTTSILTESDQATDRRVTQTFRTVLVFICLALEPSIEWRHFTIQNYVNFIKSLLREARSHIN